MYFWILWYQLPGRQVNPVAVNARFNELTGTRATLLAIISMNVPQIFACLVVLSVHWMDPDVCSEGHTRRWKLWALVAALRMLAYTGVNTFMHVFRSLLQERQVVIWILNWLLWVTWLRGCYYIRINGCADLIRLSVYNTANIKYAYNLAWIQWPLRL